MGIKGLKPFLKEIAPEAFVEVPLQKFKGTRIAIDAAGVGHQMIFRSQKQSMSKVNLRVDPKAQENSGEKLTVWFGHILRFLNTLLSYGITPIMVFDGEYLPEKAATQQKRRESSQKRVDRLKELENELQSMDPLDRPDDKVNELMKLKSSTTRLPREYVDYLRNILDCIGVPTLTAEADGEKLCCMLVREGKAAAVYSADTDCLAMGCNFWLYGFTKGKRSPNLTFDAVMYEPVLRYLQMNPDEFMDLCIMAGCDYNTNIPRVALKTAYKLLKTSRRVQNLPERYDIECLNYEFCREFFGASKCVKTLDARHNGELPCLDVDHSKVTSHECRTILDELSLDVIGMEYRASIKNVGKVADFALAAGCDQTVITNTGNIIKIVPTSQRECTPRVTRTIKVRGKVIKISQPSGTDSPSDPSDPSEDTMIAASSGGTEGTEGTGGGFKELDNFGVKSVGVAASGPLSMFGLRKFD